MIEQSERKNNLITVRMDDEGKDILDYLSDRTGRTLSDTILRACKFFSNTAGNRDNTSNANREKRCKSHYIHMRVTDSDKIFIDNCCRDTGNTVSQYVRKAVEAYYTSMNGIY